jgi:hypothetical protein
LRKAHRYDEYGERPFLFLRSWAAKIHLTLIVDDMGSINSGAQYTTPLHAVNGVAQSFSLGVGAGLTTQVQRQEDVEFLLSFKDIDKQHHDGELYTPLYHHCQPEPGLLLESDLGLQSFVDAALKPVETRILVPGNNIGPNVGPPTAIPRSDYSPLATEPSKPVNRAAVPNETIKEIAAKLHRNSPISGRGDSWRRSAHRGSFFASITSPWRRSFETRQADCDSGAGCWPLLNPRLCTTQSSCRPTICFY